MWPLATKSKPRIRSSRKRRLADSNCCKRLCRPLPNHSAKAPERRASYRPRPASTRSRNAAARVNSLDPVRELLDRVALVLEDQELAAGRPSRSSTAWMCSRLRHGHARVVSAVLDEERRPDRVDVRHRRRLDEQRRGRGRASRTRARERRDGTARCSRGTSRGSRCRRISMPAAQSSGWNASAGEHHVAAVRAPVDDRAEPSMPGARAARRAATRGRAPSRAASRCRRDARSAFRTRSSRARSAPRPRSRARRGTASAARSSARTTAATATPGRRAP